MKYLTIKNLEKYHPKFKDRNLVWCKLYFSTLNSDPEFMLLEEIDKWRFFAFVMLELQLRRAVPLNNKFLRLKGFDFRKRPLAKTIDNLINLINLDDIVISSRYQNDTLDKSREDKEYIDHFSELWNKYPRPIGKKKAEKYFKSSVKTESDLKNINIALNNYIDYIQSNETETKFVKHGATWFNNWHDWIDYKPDGGNIVKF